MSYTCINFRDVSVLRAKTVRTADDRSGENPTVFRAAHDVRRSDQTLCRKDTGIQDPVQSGPRSVISVGVSGTIRSPSRIQVHRCCGTRVRNDDQWCVQHFQLMRGVYQESVLGSVNYLIC